VIHLDDADGLAVDQIRTGLARTPCVGLSLFRRVDPRETDAELLAVDQERERVTVGDPDDPADVLGRGDRRRVESQEGRDNHPDRGRSQIARHGFRDVRVSEFPGDEILVEEIPWAAKYLGRTLMLAVQATKD
jgi:hypothetical protein